MVPYEGFDCNFVAPWRAKRINIVHEIWYNCRSSRVTWNHLLSFHTFMNHPSPTDHLPTTYRPPTDHLSTTYRPPTDRFSMVQLVQYYHHSFWILFLLLCERMNPITCNSQSIWFLHIRRNGSIAVRYRVILEIIVKKPDEAPPLDVKVKVVKLTIVKVKENKGNIDNFKIKQESIKGKGSWQHILRHYATLHYTTLHYTTLHYTTLHCTALHYTTLQYTTLHYTTLH